jgi:hypothetical protein
MGIPLPSRRMKPGKVYMETVGKEIHSFQPSQDSGILSLVIVPGDSERGGLP